jgi:predicted nucleic acid-binding Zn ribbon protein
MGTVRSKVGKCHVCGGAVTRDHGRSRQNRTCSRECMAELARMRHRREKPMGMNLFQTERYLECLENAEACMPHEREYWMSEARKLLVEACPVRRK